MEQLIAGLIGVVLGALVSEGLRARSERRRQQQALTGARRLLLEEVMTVEAIVGAGTPEEIRTFAKAGALSDEVWLAHRALFAEQLRSADWDAVAAPFWLMRVLLSHPDMSDREVEEAVERLRPGATESRSRLVKLEREAIERDGWRGWRRIL